MIQIQDLSVAFGDVLALDSISLRVDPGEWVLISGPSGCGKSTLAKALCGIIPHAVPARLGGSVVVGGLKVTEHALPMLAQHVGIVFQNPSSQLFHLRVEDEVAFGPRNLGLDEAEVKARTDWALQATGLSDLRDRRPAELSGGQKQIVAIAAVLAMRPQVLVLDEPTASLDGPNVERVMQTLAGLHDRDGLTIIMIEHRLAAALDRANRVILMDTGRIVFDGAPQDVFEDRELRNALGLRRSAQHQTAPWQQLGRGTAAVSPAITPVLSVQDVWAGYSATPVLKGVTLDIYPGDFVALVGNNGTGKSTLALVAAGLLKPKKGRVMFAGGQRPRPGKDITLLFQNAADQLFTDSVDEEIAFGPHNYGCFDPGAQSRVLAAADLTALANRRPTLLSIGQQQRTALAACLALSPSIVILDEPTLGQDWGHLQQMMDYLSLLNADGTAVLLISHDYKLVHRYANRVMFMEGGRIQCRN